MPAIAEAAVENSGSNEAGKPVLKDHHLKILKLVALGLTNQEVADELHRSLHTIKNHFSGTEVIPGIFRILDVHTRREAVVKAIEELGLLDPETLVSTEESEKCESLTKDQLEILSWLANPDLPSLRNTSVEIADKLSEQIAAQTVKNRLTAIYKDLGIQYKTSGVNSTRAAVIYLAYKRRKEATSPSHETLHESNEAGG